MTPALIAALGHLSPLNAAELAVISATASSLAAQGVPAPTHKAQAALVSTGRSTPRLTPAPSRRQRSSTPDAYAEPSSFLGTSAWHFADPVDPDLFGSAASGRAWVSRCRDCSTSPATKGA